MTILDAMNAAPRRKPSYAVTDFAAKADYAGHLASLELGPMLNKMHCRDCGKPVPSNAATCPHCREGAK